MRRSERLPLITKKLIDSPGSVISLTKLAKWLGAAKSTISEDLAIIRRVFENEGMGKIETLAGAAGGVRYTPILNNKEIASIVKELCTNLSDPKRILSGGFLYMSDILSSPSLMSKVGQIFATKFSEQKERPEVVVTLETRGIPIALMTAKALNLPLAIVRRVSRVTEGTVVTTNYVSGSAKRIETMSLSRRSLSPGTRVLLIDDFMKAGGSARGLADLMREFSAEVLGIGVLIATAQPASKLVKKYISLIVLEAVDEEKKKISIKPSSWVEKMI